jgi:hypothetical protein
MSSHRITTQQYPHVVLVLVFAGAIVLFGFLHQATADGPEVGRDAGMIFPVANDSLQLVSVRVIIRLPDDWLKPGLANCSYILCNLSSSRQEFEMAFVTNPPLARTPDGYRRQYADALFNVTLDGSPVTVQYSPVAADRWTDFISVAPDSLPTWWVEIGPCATVQLNMSYNVSWSGGSEGGHSNADFTYHARPAALWAGPIKEAEIRFELNPLAAQILKCGPQLEPCFSFSIDPPGYQWLDTGFSWYYKDWEPTTDFSFRYETYRKEP